MGSSALSYAFTPLAACNSSERIESQGYHGEVRSKALQWLALTLATHVKHGLHCTLLASAVHENCLSAFSHKR